MGKKTAPAPEGAPTELPPELGAVALALKAARDVKPAALEAAPLVAIPLGMIDFSPTNPRRVVPPREKLLELGTSIRSVGLLNPILVRRKGRRFELVHGECRVRAGRLVELDELSGRVVEWDDREVLEAQLEENLRRSDLHPLEEAAGYQELIDRHGYSADTLAARIGKSRAYVYGRLKLCALAKGPARAAFEAGELEASHALLIARVPAKLQASAFEMVRRRSFRDAQEIVQREFMLKLADAPFDTGSAELVPAAGACSACPKRTGNQRELFGDVRGADVCTDVTCFRGKAAAHFDSVAKDLPPARVLAKNKAARVFNGERLAHGAEFVDVDAAEEIPHLTGAWDSRDRRTLRAALGAKNLPEDALTLAQDGTGAARWLIRREHAVEALKAAGIGRKAILEQERSRSKLSGPRTDDRKRAIRKKLDGRAMVDAALAKLKAPGTAALVLDVFAAFVIDSVSSDVAHQVAKARGLAVGGKHPSLYRSETLELAVLKGSNGRERVLERRRLALELALQYGVCGAWDTRAARAPLTTALALLRLNPRAVAKRAAKARKAAKAAKGKATT